MAHPINANAIHLDPDTLLHEPDPTQLQTPHRNVPAACCLPLLRWIGCVQLLAMFRFLPTLTCQIDGFVCVRKVCDPIHATACSLCGRIACTLRRSRIRHFCMKNGGNDFRMRQSYSLDKKKLSVVSSSILANTIINCLVLIIVMCVFTAELSPYYRTLAFTHA